MKLRICLSIFAVWAFAAAHAQVMPDSTIQITAYWQQGDRMTYDFRSTECVVEDGDTVRMRSYADIRSIEVVNVSPTRYTLRITNHGHFEQDPVAQMVYSLEQREGLNVPLVIETSLDGELLCVVNAAEIVEAAYDLVDAAADGLYDSLPAPMRRSMPQWEWRGALEKWINPSASTTKTIEDIGRIFFFHGTRFRTDAYYERRESFRIPASDAEADGVTGWQISAGYRSYDYQQQLFDEQVAEYRAEGFTQEKAVSATRNTVADPGASEHHTGLAFDITVAGTIFKGTEQQIWLHEHCWDYGFIVRYQEDKEKITGFLAECWHIRYVGLPHSTEMRDRNLCLEEYLGEA